MIEFGSDFHYIQPAGSPDGKTIRDYYPTANFYADGRQALIHLYKSQGWECLWMPEYYCPDVIASLEAAGLVLRYYVDYPGCPEDRNNLPALEKEGRFGVRDAVLLVNYFGTRSCRGGHKPGVAAIVEDHTHDLIGEWAVDSDADWCVASLRKTLPVPEGGVLWSPLGLPLPEPPAMSEENEAVAGLRWDSMRLKARYLLGDICDKAEFRSGFINTESFFDIAPVCSLDRQSQEYLASFDVKDWYRRKRVNWEILRDIEKEGVSVMRPESPACNPFSLILLFDSSDERDRVRKALIDNNIYPTILWNIRPVDGESGVFSRKMLSIHCDGRYSPEDIIQMKSIIESVI